MFKLNHSLNESSICYWWPSCKHSSLRNPPRPFKMDCCPRSIRPTWPSEIRFKNHNRLSGGLSCLVIIFRFMIQNLWFVILKSHEISELWGFKLWKVRKYVLDFRLFNQIGLMNRVHDSKVRSDLQPRDRSYLRYLWKVLLFFILTEELASAQRIINLGIIDQWDVKKWHFLIGQLTLKHI